MNLILLFIFSAIISGKVFESDSNEPLQAHIYIENLNQTFLCDSTGEFLLPQIPAGNHTLIVSHVGFKEETLEVEAPEISNAYLNIELRQLPISIEPILVKSEKQANPGAQTIAYEEIQTIPGAEKDIFRAVQTLPGVNMPSDYLGLILVRGGELYENQVLFDGVEILSPYHYFGIGSAFNINLIDNFEFYSGTFPARFGGAISSVLSLSSKEPKNIIEGTLSIDLIEADWLYNCLITKNVSFTFSSKRNYLDVLLKNLGIAEDVILPYYIDYQTKILINSTLGSFTVSGLRSKEKTSIKFSFADEIIELDINGSGNTIATGWHKVFSTKIACQANIFYSNLNRYLYGETPGQYEYPASSSEKINIEKYGCMFHSQFNTDIMDFEIGGSIGKHSFMHSGQKIEDILYGIETFNYSLDVDTADYYTYLYASQRLYLPKHFICELGGRIDRFPIIQGPVFSPRIRLIYNKKPTMYIGYGHQHQLPPLEYELKAPNSSYAKGLCFGIEHSIKPTLFGKIEVYNKNYTNLVTKHYSDSLGTHFKTDGYGDASGIEISLRKYRVDNHWWWMSYTYASSKRTSPYDSSLSITRAHQPHVLNLVFGVSFIKGIEIGFKCLLTSGAAYDEVIGKQWSDSPAGYGKWMPVYAPDKTYLPAYQRFDIHLEKNFLLLGFNGAFYITILNITNHQNVQSYFYNDDYTMRKTLYMIPRVPLFGVRLKF